MTTLLLAYATDEGQTEKISKHSAARLEAAGHDVTLAAIGDTALPDPAEFEAAIVAGSIHLGRHQTVLEDWVEAHAAKLSAVPNMFISVSLSAASDKKVERDAAMRYVEMFSERTGFTPASVHCAAGAIHDAKTRFLRRLLVHAILKAHKVGLDPSGDTEFTDWAALDSAIDGFSGRLVGEVATSA